MKREKVLNFPLMSLYFLSSKSEFRVNFQSSLKQQICRLSEVFWGALVAFLLIVSPVFVPDHFQSLKIDL